MLFLVSMFQLAWSRASRSVNLSSETLAKQPWPMVDPSRSIACKIYHSNLQARLLSLDGAMPLASSFIQRIFFNTAEHVLVFENLHIL